MQQYKLHIISWAKPKVETGNGCPNFCRHGQKKKKGPAASVAIIYNTLLAGPAESSAGIQHITATGYEQQRKNVKSCFRLVH